MWHPTPHVASNTIATHRTELLSIVNADTRITRHIIYYVQLLSRIWVFLLALCIAVLVSIGVYLSFVRPYQYTPIHATLYTTSAVAPTQAVRIQFNTAMDAASTASQVQLVPATDARFTWNDTYTELQISPRDNWLENYTYRITIGVAARSRDNTTLRTPWEGQFITNANLFITQALPQGDHIATDAFMVVRFNRQMVALADTHRHLTNRWVSVQPALTTTAYWSDIQTLVIYPQTLQPDTPYRVFVPSYISDLDGNPLIEAYEWQFRTKPAQIIATTPSDNATQVGLQSTIVVTMTGNVAPQNLINDVDIWPATATTMTVTTPDADMLRLEIRPREQWQRDTTYRVQINGEYSSIAPFITHFRTAPDLKLMARTPGEGMPILPNQEIRFVFNSSLDSQTFADAITIDPPPRTSATISSTGRDIRISATWDLDTPTTISIADTLASSDGISLGTGISSTIRVNTTSGILSLPGALDVVYDATATKVITLTGQSALAHQYTIYDPPASTLVRLLDLPSDTLQTLDPARYNIPLWMSGTTQLTPGGNRWVIDMNTPDTEAPASRIVLLQLHHPDGSRDTRLVRLIPSNLYVNTLPTTIVVGIHDGTNPSADQPIVLMQSGQILSQGTTNTDGIWQSKPLPPVRRLVALLNTPPYDATVVSFVPNPAKPTLQMMTRQHTVTAGEVIQVLLVRTPTRQYQQHALVLQSASGQIIAQAMPEFAIDQAVTTYAFLVPRTTPAGAYQLTIPTASANTIPIIVHTTTPLPLTIQGEYVGQRFVGTLQDSLHVPMPYTNIIWWSNTQSGASISDATGVVAVDIPIDDTVSLLAYSDTHVGMHLIAPRPQPTLRITTPTQWHTSDQAVNLQLTLTDWDFEQPPPSFDIVIRAATTNAPLLRSRGTFDSNGQAQVDLSLPAGVWIATATAGPLQSQQRILVDALPASTAILNEYAQAPSDAVLQTMVRPAADTVQLVTRADDDTLQVRWLAPSFEPTITSWETVTTTTTATVTTVTPQTNSTSVMQSLPDTSCRQFETSVQPVQNGKIPVNVSVAPEHIVSALFQDHAGNTIGWYPQIKSSANGSISIAVDTTIDSPTLTITAIVHTATCQAMHHHTLTVNATPTATMTAPTHLALNDIAVISMRIHHLPANSPVNVRVAPTHMLLLDPLPQYAAISNVDGVATFNWRVRITGDAPNLRMTWDPDQHIDWTPTLITDRVDTNNDGFALTGQTTINATNRETRYDIIQTEAQLALVMAGTPYDHHNPSHLAHRYWLSNDAQVRVEIAQQIHAQRTATGGWAWHTTPDPIITNDVVYALLQAGMPSSELAPAIAYLQEQLYSAQLSPSVQALIVHTLSLLAYDNNDRIVALNQQRELIGNEGLAALILSITPDTAYVLPDLLSELMSRSQNAPRGIYWDVDPDTSSLHPLDSVNTLVYAALARIPSYQSYATQLQTFLLSRRGVDSWDNPISDARIWALRATLLPRLDGTQSTTTLDAFGAFRTNPALSPAQSLSGDIIIDSTQPVLVGIARTRQQLAIQNDALVIRQITPPRGQTLDTLTVGDMITVTVHLAAFESLPYLSVNETLPSMADVTLVAPLPQFHIVHQAPFLQQRGQFAAGDMRSYLYRYQLTQAGQFVLPPITVVDAAGIIHAQSRPYSLYVASP